MLGERNQPKMSALSRVALDFLIATLRLTALTYQGNDFGRTQTDLRGKIMTRHCCCVFRSPQQSRNLITSLCLLTTQFELIAICTHVLFKNFEHSQIFPGSESMINAALLYMYIAYLRYMNMRFCACYKSNRIELCCLFPCSYGRTL